MKNTGFYVKIFLHRLISVSKVQIVVKYFNALIHEAV